MYLKTEILEIFKEKSRDIFDKLVAKAAYPLPRFEEIQELLEEEYPFLRVNNGSKGERLRNELDFLKISSSNPQLKKVITLVSQINSKDSQDPGNLF